MNSICNKEHRSKESLYCVATGSAGDDAEASPWERLPDESSKAYHAFCLYLWNGHWRSLRKVADVLGKGISYEKQLAKWSAKFNWFERAQAFDTYVDTLLLRQYLAEQLATLERRIEHARLLEEKVFDELMSRDLKGLKPSELTRFDGIVDKIERGVSNACNAGNRSSS
jgi:hypothetical protein